MSSTPEMAYALADEQTRWRQPWGEVDVTLRIDWRDVVAEHNLRVHDRGPFRLRRLDRWGLYVGRRLQVALVAGQEVVEVVTDTVRVLTGPKVVMTSTGTWELPELRRAMAVAREIREAPEEAAEDAA